MVQISLEILKIVLSQTENKVKKKCNRKKEEDIFKVSIETSRVSCALLLRFPESLFFVASCDNTPDICSVNCLLNIFNKSLFTFSFHSRKKMGACIHLFLLQ